MEIKEITFSCMCYPWYWLASHRTFDRQGPPLEGVSMAQRKPEGSSDEEFIRAVQIKHRITLSKQF